MFTMITSEEYKELLEIKFKYEQTQKIDETIAEKIEEKPDSKYKFEIR